MNRAVPAGESETVLPRVFTIDDAATWSNFALPRLRVLLLADDDHPSDVVKDHIAIFEELSGHDVSILNPIRHRFGWSVGDAYFDAIIIHYSISVIHESYFPEKIAACISIFRGPKLLIIQDEYESIDRVNERIIELGIDVVFSSLSQENITKVYHHNDLSKVCFCSSLPGYVPRRLRTVVSPPLSQRGIDIVYRGRQLPISMGKFAQEKALIGIHGLAFAKKYNLSADCEIGEKKRIYGDAWGVFLMSGKAALATEGGATVFDFDETLKVDIAEFRRQNPNANDDEVYDAVVRGREGNITHKTITPRILEAALYRTALILYPGEYRNVLKPWDHYIPLERDGSNEALVAEFIKDDVRLQELVERTHSRIITDQTLSFEYYASAISNVLGKIISRQRAVINKERIYIKNKEKQVIERKISNSVINFIDYRLSAFSLSDTYSYKIALMFKIIYQPKFFFTLVFRKGKLAIEYVKKTASWR